MLKHIKQDKKSGLWYRPDKYDLYIINEVKCYKPMLQHDNDIVLDLGANIGAFTVLAWRMGANKVISVEPEPENFELLVKNIGSNLGRNINRVELCQAAVVRKYEGPIRLYLNQAKNCGAHSIVPGRRPSIEVEAVSLSETLERKPTAVKIDIEGAEYGLLPFVRKEWKTVRALAIEIHLNRKEWRSEAAPNLIQSIYDLGFKALKEPVITESNWHTLGIFVKGKPSV